MAGRIAGGLGIALCDTDQGRAQEAVMHDIAGLKYLDDRAVGLPLRHRTHDTLFGGYDLVFPVQKGG